MIRCQSILATLLLGLSSAIALDDRLGLQTHWDQGVWPDPQAALIPATGAAWIRDNAGWQTDVEQQKGVYTLPTKVTHFLDQATKYGLKVNLNVLGPNTLYADPEDPQAFSNMVAWLTGALKAWPCVQAIEILNEPNNNYRQTEKTPGYTDWRLAYVNLANMAYSAIKAVNPGMIVIGAGSGNTSDNLFMLQNGLSLDGYTDHPYQGNVVEQGFNSKVASYRALTSKPLWFTEYGKSTQVGASNAWWERENEQAIELLRQTLFGFGLGVEHQFIYEFSDDGSINPYDNGSNFGISFSGLYLKQMYYVLERTMPVLAGTYKIRKPDQGFWGFYQQQAGFDQNNFYAFAFECNSGSVIAYWFGVAAWLPETFTVSTWYYHPGWSSVVVFDPLSGIYTPVTATCGGDCNSLIVNIPVSDRPKLLIIR